MTDRQAIVRLLRTQIAMTDVLIWIVGQLPRPKAVDDEQEFVRRFEELKRSIEATLSAIEENVNG